MWKHHACLSLHLHSAYKQQIWKILLLLLSHKNWDNNAFSSCINCSGGSGNEMNKWVIFNAAKVLITRGLPSGVRYVLVHILKIFLISLIVTFVMLLPKKEHVLAIFFDLEKAYDTTWKHGILSDLYDLDFWGHLPTFIDGFLSHRLFQVRTGSTLIRMSKRWVFLEVASCLRFFSVLKLTILSSQSWKVQKRHCSWMILPFVYEQSSSHMHRDLCNCV